MHCLWCAICVKASCPAGAVLCGACVSCKRARWQASWLYSCLRRWAVLANAVLPVVAAKLSVFRHAVQLCRVDRLGLGPRRQPPRLVQNYPVGRGKVSAHAERIHEEQHTQGEQCDETMVAWQDS